ncbi:MAG: thioredoxin [Puniceicoccales bacterium]|jgi:thioredoxin 1|nr:thioredoxin [Puniceicoccales bacterium]
MASAKIIDLNTANFAETINSATVPVLVDFWAAWCGPCKAIAPVLDQIADELGDAVKITKVDVDSNMPLAQQYGVQNIPTLLIFKGGQIAEKIVGTKPKADLVAAIQRHQ